MCASRHVCLVEAAARNDWEKTKGFVMMVVYSNEHTRTPLFFLLLLLVAAHLPCGRRARVIWEKDAEWIIQRSN